MQDLTSFYGKWAIRSTPGQPPYQLQAVKLELSHMWGQVGAFGPSFEKVKRYISFVLFIIKICLSAVLNVYFRMPVIQIV